MDRYKLVERLDADQVRQLHRLVQRQWWGANRSLDEVTLMVEHTSLMVSLVDESTDMLVGSARVLTDFAFRATIYDVMIDEAVQGQGLGKRLIDALCDHPKLRRVSLIYLACEPNLFPFYERWGFSEYDGRALWMMKVQRAE